MHFAPEIDRGVDFLLFGDVRTTDPRCQASRARARAGADPARQADDEADVELGRVEFAGILTDPCTPRQLETRVQREGVGEKDVGAGREAKTEERQLIPGGARVSDLSENVDPREAERSNRAVIGEEDLQEWPETPTQSGRVVAFVVTGLARELKPCADMNTVADRVPPHETEALGE